ncbi:uncharacterized protein LOC115463361 isoform X2 [Microcaecilia unicolor]|uniref:Uncharacterized protein LOC115463361 isoform X2 n=1 Tax=Microcaecilia unicolor TaxID=1415580 RepID=A0A6P7X255_9AMPH|nr:uncharacterized protein LOC115463361 isoform X2 [Microcaecilia unicolor]
MQDQTSSTFEICFLKTYFLRSKKQRLPTKDVQCAQALSFQTCVTTRSQKTTNKRQNKIKKAEKRYSVITKSCMTNKRGITRRTSAMQDQTSSTFEICFLNKHFLRSKKQRLPTKDVQCAQALSFQTCVTTRSQKTTNKRQNKIKKAEKRYSVIMKSCMTNKRGITRRTPAMQDQTSSTSEICFLNKYFLRSKKQRLPTKDVQYAQALSFQTCVTTRSQKTTNKRQNKIKKAEKRYSVIMKSCMTNKRESVRNLILKASPHFQERTIICGSDIKKFYNIMSVASQKSVIVKQSACDKFELAAGERADDKGGSIYYHPAEDNKSKVALVLTFGEYILQLCYKKKLYLEKIDQEDKYDHQHLFIIHKNGNVWSFQWHLNKDLYLCVKGENIDMTRNNQKAELQFEIEMP